MMMRAASSTRRRVDRIGTIEDDSHLKSADESDLL